MDYAARRCVGAAMVLAAWTVDPWLAPFLHTFQAVSCPFFPRFLPFFARFHRLDEAVPASPKPEPRAKKQPTRPHGPPSIQSPSAYGTNQLLRAVAWCFTDRLDVRRLLLPKPPSQIPQIPSQNRRKSSQISSKDRRNSSKFVSNFTVKKSYLRAAPVLRVQLGRKISVKYLKYLKMPVKLPPEFQSELRTLLISRMVALASSAVSPRTCRHNPHAQIQSR